MSDRNPESGFTLLELMVSLAIMSLIALMLGSSLSSMSRLLSRSTGYEVILDEALARQKLKAMIEAIPRSATSQANPILISGTNKALSFQTIIDDGIYWPGAPVIVDVETSADGGIIVTTSGLSDAARMPTEIGLALSGLRSEIDIAYFGRPSAEVEPTWLPDWPATAGAPLLVKLSITQDGQVTPPIVAQPSKKYAQSEMSLSSLVPPAIPSRP